MEITTNYIEQGYIVKKDDENEEVIQIPYNITNSYVSENDIIELLKRNNVKIDKINHLHFFQKAFTHKSYCDKKIIPEEVLAASKPRAPKP